MSLPSPHPSLIAAFEQASNDAQIPNARAVAERTLGSLTSHPDSIPLMFAVLQSTSSSLARFHAAKALHTATRDRWHTLSPYHRHSPSSFRHSLINIVIANPHLQNFERLAILRTVAFLTRRAYLEEIPASRDTFFSQLSQSASPMQSPPHTVLTTIQLIELIIDEFTTGSGSSPSSVAIDREMFMRARHAFSSPQGHMISLFHTAVSLLTFLTSSSLQQPFASPSFSETALPALAVIHRVLTTDFRNAPPASDIDNNSTFDPTNSFSSDALEMVVINTFAKPEWHPLINEISVLLPVCFSILAALIAAPSSNSGSDSEFLLTLLYVITDIAAITHESYLSTQSALGTLSSILNGMNEQKWSVSPLGPVRLAYAEIWRRLSFTYGLTNVERLPSSYIAVFTADTCHQMEDMVQRTVNSSDDSTNDDFSMDVIDLLLETWASLALQGHYGASSAAHPLSRSIEPVILHFMRMSLRTTGDYANASIAGAAPRQPDIEDDLGFDDFSIGNARLSVAAILTRFVLDKMVTALVQSLIQAADKVFNWPHGQTSVNGFPLDMYQEDLYFLIRLTSAVLTDDAKGENPSVPTQFLPFHENVTNRHGKPCMYAHALLSALFEVAERESQMLSERGAHSDEASPRVGCALLDALERVVRTYLAPLNTESAAMAFEIAGGQQVVEQGRNCCFMKTMEGLTQRGFEGDISEAAGDLLSTLATASKTYRELTEDGTWRQILQAGVEAFQTLAPKAVQDVGKSLTTVLGNVIVDQLLIPAYGCLQTFANSQNQVADAAERVLATLNLVRGAARCDTLDDRSRRTLTMCLHAPDGVAAMCAKSFGKTRPDVSRLVMLLADDIVYNTLVHLSEQEARVFLNHVLTLMKMHAEIIKSQSVNVCLADLVGDVEEMLSILTHVLDEEMDVDVGEACFYGLSTLLTVMNEEVLDVPSVNRGFFRFVAQLVCAHAEKLIVLPPDFCSKILHSIDMQRASFDTNSERKALEAITSLARTRVLALKPPAQLADQPPGASHDQTNTGESSVVVDNALRGFLVRIFEAIANGSAHTTNLDAAADSLLALAHIRTDNNAGGGGSGSQIAAFEQVAQVLVSSSGNNSELRMAVTKLAHATSEAGVAYGFDGRGDLNGSSPLGPNRAAILNAKKRFREAVAIFSNEARNCLVSVALASSTNN